MKHCHQCTAATESGSRCRLRTCATGPYCWIHTRKLEHLRVKPSGVHGKGLFADDPQAARRDVVFNRNDLVTEYKGDVYTRDEARALPNNSYVINAGSGFYVDAQKTDSSVGRYSNDCRRTGKRCNARFWTSRRAVNDGRVWISAKEPIRNGQEILTSYGAGYWYRR
jgi:hypothetical protein